MTLLGCDTDEMARLEELLAREADRFASAVVRVDSALGQMVWDGHDSLAFKQTWRARGRPSCNDAAALLRASAREVRRNRLEQLAASEGNGGPNGAAAGHGGPPAPDIAGGPGALGAPVPEPPGGWGQQAANHAGIDLNAWDPTRGAAANAANIKAVYSYYGQLYLAHPELQWAGMANLIGPSFAAGFFDLGDLRDAAQRISSALDHIPPALRPPDLNDVDALAHLSADDIHFYETTFLRMQREIFLDQASMHEAYVTGGIPALEQMRADGRIDDKTLTAWRQIDEGARTGNQALIAEGNRGLLWREQHDIIRDDWDSMYHHVPTGPAMTYLMTLTGQPSVPGARGYADVFPLKVNVDTPGPRRIGTPSHIGTPRSIGGVPLPNIGVDIPSVSVDNPLQGTVVVTTPFPDGNIANFEDRWNLIATDTLPAYQKQLQHPDKVAALVGSDVGSRIDDNRLSHRVDKIIAHLLDWRVHFKE